MHTPTALLAAVVTESAVLTARFFQGFDDTNRLAQAPNIPNHAAWTLGHLALTMARCAQRLGGPDLNPSHFGQGADTGTATAFGTEQVCIGSTPTDNPDIWPTWDNCRRVFEAATQTMADAVASLTTEQLDADTPWGNSTITNHQLIVRVTVHNGVHTGQLIDLRRAFGLPGVVG